MLNGTSHPGISLESVGLSNEQAGGTVISVRHERVTVPVKNSRLKSNAKAEWCEALVGSDLRASYESCGNAK